MFYLLSLLSYNSEPTSGTINGLESECNLYRNSNGILQRTGRVSREPEEYQIGLCALLHADGGSAEVQHGSLATGQTSSPLPDSPGEPSSLVVPGRGARPGCSAKICSQRRGWHAWSQEGREGQKGCPSLRLAEDTTPHCCEQLEGFTTATTATPPTRAGDCCILPTVHLGSLAHFVSYKISRINVLLWPTPFYIVFSCILLGLM